MSDLINASLRELAAALDAKQVSSVELSTLFLDRSLALNLAAYLNGDTPQPAAGTVTSSGGNFADPTAPIQDAFGLGDLLPYTELSFPAAAQEEVIPNPIDEEPTTVIITPALLADARAHWGARFRPRA